MTNNQEKRPITLRMDQNVIPAQDFKAAVDAFIDLIQSVSETVEPDAKIHWGIGVERGSAVINAFPQGDGGKYLQVVADAVTAGLVSLSAGSEARPRHFNDKALQAARRLSSLRTEEIAVSVSSPWEEVPLTKRVAVTVQEAMGTKYSDYGTIEGTIDVLKIGKAEGHEARIRDDLTNHETTVLLPDADALDAFFEFAKSKRRVSITGLVQYRAGGVPKSIAAETFEIFSEGSELPSIQEMIGILKSVDVG